MLKTAKVLHGQGWAIHWLMRKSKRPKLKHWTTGPRKDLEHLLATYAPGDNMGVRLGKASRLKDGFYLGAIDCDVKSDKPEHLEEMSDKLEELGIGESLTVFSGRGNGSKHLYVKSLKPLNPRRVAQSGAKVRVKMPSAPPSKFEKDNLSQADLEAGWRLRPAWEIAIMGEGQQVVLPPSIHPDTLKMYRWGSNAHLNDLSLVEFEDKGGGERDAILKERIQDWEPVPVDLIGSSLSDDIVNKIVSGVDIEDRSAALFGVVFAMKGAGFDERQILSVLTDEKNFLGKVAYDHAKTRSRKRAAEWVLNFTLKKAKKKAGGRDDFEVVDIDAAEEPVDEGRAAAVSAEVLEVFDWRVNLEKNIQDGRPKHTLKNLLLIFRELAEGEPFIMQDQFAVEVKWVRNTPWGNEVGGSLTDGDCRRIKNYLSKHFRMEPGVEKILEALLICAEENNFHPVRDFVSRLQWDGKERAERWLETYLGATGPQKYLRAVGLKTLVAMIARVFQPGVKFDHVLILEGLQGAGKSSTARILSSPWFSDTYLDVNNKDAVLNMQGTWINELGELSAMNRSEVNTLKEFVTRQTDKIRPPYGRLTMSYPRQNIFIGTTNNKDYLRDATGNRRFWPVEVEQLDFEGLKRDRDQLLAEAYAWWKMGEPLYLADEEEQAQALAQQAARLEYDELEGVISELVDSPAIGSHFTIYQLMQAGRGEMDGLRNDRATQMRIGPILRKLGFCNDKAWDKKQKKTVRKWHKKGTVERFGKEPLIKEHLVDENDVGSEVG